MRNEQGGISRRDALKMGFVASAGLFLPLGFAGDALGWSNSSWDGHWDSSWDSRDSTSPTFTPYTTDLPIAPVLSPTSSTSTTDYYNVNMQPTQVQIIPGVTTPVWTYNGLYPGPTIKARKGRQVVIRQQNSLPETMTVHLHGAYVDGDSDGHPNDLIAPGAYKDYIYANNMNARTLWYHDHAEMTTARHVYRGLAGFYILTDDLEDSLPLPKGAYDVPLVIQDRRFNSDGTLNYPSDSVSDEGFQGDVIVVNGAARPRFQVANRKYRFRILNGSDARPYKLALSSGSFTLIGTEGGLRETPLSMSSLPIWPAERYEIVIDFSKYAVGSKVVLKNLLGSGSTAEIMRFDVVRQETDDSSLPSTLRSAANQADDTHQSTTAAASVATRYWDFDREWPNTYVINGKTYDPNRFDATPKEGTTEIWSFSTGRGWSHPVHVHLTNFKILDRNGKAPLAHEQGWKETLALGPDETIRVLIKWPKVPLGPIPGNFTRRYVFHCHNLEHEDHDMMAQFKIIQ
jgi:spore coat protein A, manganese oxidase